MGYLWSLSSNLKRITGMKDKTNAASIVWVFRLTMLNKFDSEEKKHFLSNMLLDPVG